MRNFRVSDKSQKKATDWKTERLKMENVIKSTVNCL